VPVHDLSEGKGFSIIVTGYSILDTGFRLKKSIENLGLFGLNVNANDILVFASVLSGLD